MARRRKNHPGGNRAIGRRVFADAGFWVALLRLRDQWGDAALRWKSWLADTPREILTTELVFWEGLNGLSAPPQRSQAIGAYRACEEDPGIEILPLHAEELRDALALYE